ncbi:MAG: hypothetical protein AMS19_00390 [Gemmatimonas sp. SG8_23]|jgi:5-(carboxyamino)imidazole ribonucleotide mutase|nr:MAG: hypothetical protein AMS19_00390 [Gemmatimonas sp. SG8_23]
MSARVEQGGGARVAIIMGSDSDLPEMKGAAEALDALEVPYEMSVVSAHRTPSEMARFAEEADGRGIAVIIAGAGGAAHLPGMVAAFTPIPVLGVPVPVGPMNGIDALLSIVQMPKGVPVGSMAIGGSYNAGLLAAQIVAFGGKEADRDLAERVAAFKENMRQQVIAKQI